MNRTFGAVLVVLALAAGWQGYGWAGLALSASVIVFWLLLQFSRSLRVLRQAGQAPIGRVPSAVMLHAKLRTGMTLADTLAVTRSLGRRVGADPETWAWADDSGAEVVAVYAHGRCTGSTLQRPSSDPASERANEGTIDRAAERSTERAADDERLNAPSQRR